MNFTGTKLLNPILSVTSRKRKKMFYRECLDFAMGGISSALRADKWLLETSPKEREGGFSCHQKPKKYLDNAFLGTSLPCQRWVTNDAAFFSQCKIFASPTFFSQVSRTFSGFIYYELLLYYKNTAGTV